MKVNSLGAATSSWSTLYSPDTWRPLGGVLAGMLVAAASATAVGSGTALARPAPGSGSMEDVVRW